MNFFILFLVEINEFHSIHSYLSCPHCTKGIQNGEATQNCWRCDKLVPSYVHDFKYEITVIHGNDAKNLLGFRKKLPNLNDFTEEHSDEKIKELLNKKYGRTSMNIDYTKNKHGDFVVAMFSAPNNN